MLLSLLVRLVLSSRVVRAFRVVSDVASGVVCGDDGVVAGVAAVIVVHKQGWTNPRIWTDSWVVESIRPWMQRCPYRLSCSAFCTSTIFDSWVTGPV